MASDGGNLLSIHRDRSSSLWETPAAEARACLAMSTRRCPKRSEPYEREKNLHRLDSHGELSVHDVLSLKHTRLEKLGNRVQIGERIAHTHQILVKRLELSGGERGRANFLELFHQRRNDHFGGIGNLIVSKKLMQLLKQIRNHLIDFFGIVALDLLDEKRERARPSV